MDVSSARGRHTGNAYKILFWGDLEVEKDNIRIGHKCMGYESLDWIQLFRNGAQFACNFEDS
jgi:hypothetical protein